MAPARGRKPTKAQETAARLAAQEEENARILQENAQLLARIQEAEATAAALAQQAATAAAATTASTQANTPNVDSNGTPRAQRQPMLIRRPKGDFSHSQVVRETLGIDNLTYDSMRRTVRLCVDVAGLDWKEDWRRQDVNKVNEFFNVTAERDPLFKRFEGNWAAAKFAAEYMGNLRRDARDFGRIPPAPPRKGVPPREPGLGRRHRGRGRVARNSNE